jgi:hypothetical protein
MIIERPTLNALRARVHKDHHREIGNWLARRVARPAAVPGTWLAIRLGLSAHQVTCLALIVQVGAALVIGTGDRLGFMIGVILLHLAFWLDHVDGQVARWRGTSSLDGVYLDYLLHHVGGLTLGFALGQGLAQQTRDPSWSIAGFAIAVGWTFLNLHNDCRYKAFFQRLKRESLTYRIDGGSGDRPSPAPSWPKRGRGLLTWPIAKSCEPHVVLMSLTVMVFVAIFAPGVWWELWKSSVLAMAVIAPLLAIGRSSRAILKRATEKEFDRWFRPL